MAKTSQSIIWSVSVRMIDAARGVSDNLCDTTATRAIDRFVVTYQRKTELMEYVERSLVTARQISEMKQPELVAPQAVASDW